MTSRLSVIRCLASYPGQTPFHPSEAYPEVERLLGPGCAGAEKNYVYSAVRDALKLCAENDSSYGSGGWNPLGKWIRPGNTVLLKPNFVKDTHPRDPRGWVYTITHGSVIRAIADYVWIALEGRGKVIVGDAPQTDSSFARIRELVGLDCIQEFYSKLGLDFEIVDLRKEEWINRAGVIAERTTLAGDSRGYARFDLGNASELANHWGAGSYYGADYDSEELNRHHSEGRHEYLISGTAVQADVVISLPKIKTHKKAGVTLSLKNLVGINGDKNWLPHHTESNGLHAGDERPVRTPRARLERGVARRLRALTVAWPSVGAAVQRLARNASRPVFGDTEDVIRSGNWWGNDTVWRMCLDLNKILMYGDPQGNMRQPDPHNRKAHLALADGIIAGQGRGPLNPDPYPAGIIVFGSNPAELDAACAVLMGFDPDKIPVIRQAFRCSHYPVAQGDWRDLWVASDRPEWEGRLGDISPEATLHFEPHFGWKGHIERNPSTVGVR